MSDIKSKYTFVDYPGKDYSAIRLTEETSHPNFIFHFGEVKMLKENDDGTATLEFNYIVDEDNGHKISDNEPELFKLMGDILVDIIETNLEYAKNESES